MTVRRPWAGRGATVALAVPLAIGAALVPAQAGAAAPKADAGLARIVSPQRDATVRGGATVEVRLKATVRSFSATLDGRPIGGRFARRGAGGRARVATLRPGGAGDLRAGVNRLVVRTRDRTGAVDTDVVRFALVRRSAALLQVSAPRRARGTARVRLRVADPDAVVTARLNGRTIDPPEHGRRIRTLVLSADEGLRFGANALRVSAVDREHGRTALVRRTVVVGRGAPIPAAGRDRAATAGRVVVLDARRSRAAQVPGSLGYRWSFARKPRGSRARLRDATAARPRFTPDRPGRYRLRLTVSERRAPARRAGAGAAASAAAAPDPAPASGPAATLAASDTTIADVTPVTPAVGIPLNTLASVSGSGTAAVQVGDFRYAPPDASKALQLVVLDRRTLELVSNSSFDGSDAGTASLKAAVAALDSSVLAIVATPRLGAAAPLPDATALANVNAALKAIGVNAIPAATVVGSGVPQSCAGLDLDACAGFSAVGVPGLPAGQGALNPGSGSTTGGRAGNGGALTGYLQPDQHGNFAFASGEYVPFDTTAPGTTNGQAVISVGGATYSSDVLPSPYAGAYVLVLDAGTLAYRASGTFRLRYGDLDGLVANMQQMTAFLTAYSNDPTLLVFTQTIGRLARWDGFDGRGDLPYWWNRVAAAEQRLGGHAMLFDALTDDGYARVGPTQFGAQYGYPAPWTKLAGPKVSNTPAELTGTLARSPNWQFYAKNAAAVADVTSELPVLAYQAPTPWPLRDTAARRAAISCVATALSLDMPIESNYASATLDWGTRAATMGGLAYGDLAQQPTCDPSQFGAADLAAVKAQLGKELTAVADVRDWVGKLKEPFSDSAAISPLKVAAISDQIKQSVAVPDGEPAGADPLGLAEDAFLVLGALPGVGELTGGDLIASMIGLVADTTTEPDGAKELAYDATTADELGERIDDSYLDAKDQFDHVFAILVGDWGKLSAVEQRQRPGQVWDWDDGMGRDAVTLLGFGAQRQAYEQLFPAVYDGLLRGTRGKSATDVPDDPRAYTCTTYKQSRGTTTFTPFGGSSAGGAQTVVTNAGPVRENWVLSAATAANAGEDDGMLRGWEWKPRFPSDQLTSAMFATDATGLTVPPLQPLPFALDVYGKLKVLTIHWEDGGEDADGNVARNLCFGR